MPATRDRFQPVTVQVNYTSVQTVVQQLVTNTDVASGLVSKLQAAAAAAARGDTTSKTNQINAFINQVNAQTGKSITSAQAALLISLAQAL